MAELDTEFLRALQPPTSQLFGEAYDGMPVRPLTASGLAAELLHGNAAEIDHTWFSRPLALHETVPDFWQFQQQFQPTIAPFRNYERTWDISGGSGNTSSLESQISEFFNRNQFLRQPQPIAPQINYGWPGTALVEPGRPRNWFVTPAEGKSPEEVHSKPKILPHRLPEHPGVSDAEARRFERISNRATMFTDQAKKEALRMDPQEQACFDKINSIRARNGLRPLVFSPTVKLVSDLQAHEQAVTHSMKHSNRNPSLANHFRRLNQVLLGRDTMDDGENAAMGAQGGVDVANMWMGSAGHRRPILDGNLRIGSVSRELDNRGTPYWTFNASTGNEIRDIPNSPNHGRKFV